LFVFAGGKQVGNAGLERDRKRERDGKEAVRENKN
jgi:hypothetical protein